jgi:DNA primase small subunit
MRLDRGALEVFDPLEDAIPQTFRNHEITIDLSEGRHVELGEISRTFEPGSHAVPEYVGVFLMARGWAEKGRE